MDVPPRPGRRRGGLGVGVSVDSRAPARPASASPIAVSIRRSPSQTRDERRVSRSTCSTNVLRRHSGLSQKNRRTLRKIRISRPATGASVNVRRYRECTLDEGFEQARHTPSSPRTVAMSATSASECSSSISMPARWGRSCSTHHTVGQRLIVQRPHHTSRQSRRLTPEGRSLLPAAPVRVAGGPQLLTASAICTVAWAGVRCVVSTTSASPCSHVRAASA